MLQMDNLTLRAQTKNVTLVMFDVDGIMTDSAYERLL